MLFRNPKTSWHLLSTLAVLVDSLCPSTCPAGWQTFQNADELGKDRWGQYLEAVYGELPPASEYPLCTGCFWMFYDLLLEVFNVNLPPAVGSCPSSGAVAAEGQRYNINNIYQPDDVSWSWHPYPYQGFAASTWIEVTHQADPFGDEHFGAWFLYAKGSGAWFNVGHTIIFAEHQDAYAFFRVTKGDLNEELAKAAAAQNYDSVQFVAHVDPVEYKKCDTSHTGAASLKYMNVEIVGVKLTGTYACTQQNGAPTVIRAGWAGSKPCQCDNTKSSLNCKIFPAPSPPPPPPPPPPPHTSCDTGGCLGCCYPGTGQCCEGNCCGGCPHGHCSCGCRKTEAMLANYSVDETFAV